MVPGCIPEQLPARDSWWEGAGMQEERSLRGNGNGAEPWKRLPFQRGLEAFWETGGSACHVCRAQTPRRQQRVCPVADVTQVRLASSLPGMLLQEEGVGARRSLLSLRDHTGPAVGLAAGCRGFEPGSAFGPSPGLAWMMCADTRCFRRSPGASCHLVIPAQGARAGVPVNFRSFGVGFVCVGFKGNITVPCLSWAELLAQKGRKASARWCCFRVSSPRIDKIWRSLLQTLLDKSHGTQSTAELWFGPS